MNVLYAYGAMMGACCGDAAGAVLEFLNHKPTRSDIQNAMKMCGGGHHRVAPGQITDDGELTISLARGLANCKGVFDSNKIAEEYAAWYKTSPFDVGTTTFQSIGAAVRGEANIQYKQEILEKKGYAYAMNWGATSGEAKMSKANGSLMRASPLGIFAYKLPAYKIAKLAKSDNNLTHPHASCGDAVACYAIAIAHLLNHPGDNKGAFNAAKRWLSESSQDSEVCNWLNDAENNVDVEYYPNAGFIKIGFTHAFRHLYNYTDYVDAIAETLSGGGDTDTNACIVGGLLGALHGINGIPENMRNAVLQCNTSAGRIRPATLHPSLLEQLAQDLLAYAPSDL